MRKRIRTCLMGMGIALAVGIVCSTINASDSAAKRAGRVTSVQIKGAGSYLLLNKGEKKKLKTAIRPKNAVNKSLKWKSSKKSVVSVTQKGEIRGRRYGTALVTVQAKDGSGKKAKIRVQVGRKVTKVGLPAKSIYLDVKASVNIKGTVTPSNATKRKLSYRSSNTRVAAVSSTGVVTGKTKGTSVITASSQDGSGKKATCKVQVRVPSRSVIVDADAVGTRLESGQTLTIHASVQPADASNKGIRYTSVDSRIARVSQSGVVTGVDPGMTTIRVEAADGRSHATVEVEVYKVELKDEKLIAHRGFSSQAPENTTAAFELAVQKGFYGVECDLRKTLDDKFIIMHDADLNRMCGYNLKIANMDLHQLKKYKITSGTNIEQYPELTVPTLEEYLEILSQNESVHPFIELKEEFTQAELESIVGTVKKYGLLDRTYFISIHKSNLLYLKEMDGVNKDFLQYVYGAEASNKHVAVDNSVINWCISNGIDLDARYTLVRASDVYRLHEAGRKVNVWTVNVLAKAFELVTDAQVDMVTTEYYLNS